VKRRGDSRADNDKALPGDGVAAEPLLTLVYRFIGPGSMGRGIKRNHGASLRTAGHGGFTEGTEKRGGGKKGREKRNHGKHGIHGKENG